MPDQEQKPPYGGLVNSEREIIEETLLLYKKCRR